MISDLGLSAEELDFLIKRKYKNAENGRDYIISESVSRDERGRLVHNKDADITDWYLDFDLPTKEDIQRVLDLFGDEMKTAVRESSENEAPVEDTGV